ncbi:MAG: DUF1573 domain-containing protein [Bacteroidetes bacterium]|nr:DUF1573 domain-containing protein [Bacteroidota bacterium]
MNRNTRMWLGLLGALLWLVLATDVCAQATEDKPGKKKRRRKKTEKPRLELVNPAQAAELRRKRQEDSLAVTVTYTPDTTQTIPAAAGPRMVMETETYGFGQVHQGVPVQYSFRFRNTGTAPLRLLEVTPSCGCTATDWPKDPVPPGGEGEIVVSFNTVGKLGPQMKHIFVRYNAQAGDPEEAEEAGRIMLILRGEVTGLPGPPSQPDQE